MYIDTLCVITRLPGVLCESSTSRWIPFRPVATGGRGGAQPPLEKFERPLGCLPWHFIGIGIEVYSPLEFCQPPPTNDTWLRRWYPWVIQLSLLSLPSRDQYRYAVYRHCWRTVSDSISTEDRHLCEFYDYVPLAQCPIIVSNRSDPISSETAIFTFTWDHTDQTTDQLIAPLCQLISHNLAFWWGIIMNRCRKHFSNPRQQTLVSCSIKHRETHHQAYGGSCARLSRTSECENEAPEVGRLFALSDGKFSDRWPQRRRNRGGTGGTCPPTFLPRVWSALPALGYMLGLQCIRKECPEGQ